MIRLKEAVADEVLWQFCRSSNCPFNCTHCMAKFIRCNELPYEKKLIVLDNILLSGINTVSLTGGEPLLHKETELLIDHANDMRNNLKNSIKVFLCTSGYGFDLHKAEFYKNSNITIRLSVHSMKSSSSLYSLESSELIKMLNICDKTGLRIQINTLILSGFANQYDQIIELLSNYSIIDSWNIVAPYRTENFKNDSLLWPKFADWEAALKIKYLHLPFPKVVSKFVFEDKRFLCKGPWFKVFVNPLGYISKCFMISDETTRDSLLDLDFKTIYKQATRLAVNCHYRSKNKLFPKSNEKSFCALNNLID